eukprot:5527332-Amphidinium_carterae.1
MNGPPKNLLKGGIRERGSDHISEAGQKKSPFGRACPCVKCLRSCCSNVVGAISTLLVRELSLLKFDCL